MWILRSVAKGSSSQEQILSKSSPSLSQDSPHDQGSLSAERNYKGGRAQIGRWDAGELVKVEREKKNPTPDYFLELGPNARFVKCRLLSRWQPGKILEIPVVCTASPLGAGNACRKACLGIKQRIYTASKESCPPHPEVQLVLSN